MITKYVNRLNFSLIVLVMLTWWGCKSEPAPEQSDGATTSVDLEYIKIDTAGPQNPWAKFSGDLDKDGIADIIIGGQRGPLLWYKYPEWTKHQIAEGGYDTVDGEVGDIDGDGDLDIVMGGLVWFENPGDLSDSPDGMWPVHRVAEHPTHDIEIADLNQDGRNDIISRDQSAFGSKQGNRIHLWMNLGNDQWEQTILDCPDGEGIAVSDLDGDQDADIIIGGIWFENGLTSGQMSWTSHSFAGWHDNASVQVADINKDGKKDIILTPSELAGNYYHISWFEAPDDRRTEKWVEHRLLDSVECVIHSLAVGDLNGDGAVDIAYAEMHQGGDPDEVAILLNQGNGAAWRKQLLSQRGSHGLRIDDINNDRQLDVFGANWSGDYQPVEVWLNENE